MAREIIRPTYGEPCFVTLYHAPDKAIQREGQNGVDYEFKVNEDSGIMWLPREAKEAITATRAQAGDEVAISKMKRGRQTIWAAELVREEPAPPAARPNALTPPTPATAPQPAPPPPPTAPAAATATPARPAAAMLAGALYAAIDAAIAAEAYAQQKGMPLKFGTDDVRALGITIWIDARKEAR